MFRGLKVSTLSFQHFKISFLFLICREKNEEENIDKLKKKIKERRLYLFILFHCCCYLNKEINLYTQEKKEDTNLNLTKRIFPTILLKICREKKLYVMLLSSYKEKKRTGWGLNF